MTQAVIPQLEAVQIQKEEQTRVAAHAVQRLLSALIEHGAVRVNGSGSRSKPVGEYGACLASRSMAIAHQVQAGQNQLAMQLVARVAVEVQRKRADHLTCGGF